MRNADTSRTSSARRSARLFGVAIVVALLATSCSVGRQAVEDELESHTEGTFYDVPDTVPAGEPGTIVRQERLLGAPDGSIAWRVMYRSTDKDGAPMVVTGIVVAPTVPALEGGHPIVSWGHPTTGSEGRCATSVGFDPFVLIEGLHELLAAGYVVAATDYPDMGAAGPPSYLIGATEGNSVLDAARAARHISEAGAGDDLLLWGHSQGGHAALFAAQLAPAYAPELHLRGVATAAPAAEIGELLNDDIGDVSGVTISAYAFDAYQQAYGPDDPSYALTTILTPAGAAAVPKMAPLCLLGQNKELHDIAGPLVGTFVANDPTTTEPWATRLTENTPGGAPIGVPILINQGDADTLVKPQTTDDFVSKLCAAGEHVEHRTYPGGHGTIAELAVPHLLEWFDDVLRGRDAPDTCTG